MKYVKSDSASYALAERDAPKRIILVSPSNLGAWVEVGLRSLGELKDEVTPIEIKIGEKNKTGLIPITVSLKNEKKGVLIEH